MDDFWKKMSVYPKNNIFNVAFDIPLPESEDTFFPSVLQYKEKPELCSFFNPRISFDKVDILRTSKQTQKREKEFAKITSYMDIQ